MFVFSFVVGGVFSARASTVQHCNLCWPDFQCETDPSMYPYFIVFHLLCVTHCTCPFFVSILVCLYLLVSYFSVSRNEPRNSHGFLLPGSFSSLFVSIVDSTSFL